MNNNKFVKKFPRFKFKLQRSDEVQMNSRIDSIESYLKHLSKINNVLDKKETYYRGHSVNSYDLTPSIFRNNFLEREHIIYSEVMTNCSHEFENCILHNEKLSKMQHYGVPTRLLDITSNALVALYFACEDNLANHGAVFVIKSDISKVKQYDSDTISILSSLPRFNYNEKMQMINSIKAFNSESENTRSLKKFNKDNKIIQRLLHEIKKEKPAFDDIIEPNDLLNNYIYIPRKINARIIRQSGAFIIFGLDNISNLNNKSSDLSIEKIEVQASSKNHILNQLSTFGITKASIYPELYKVAEYLKER